MTQPTDNVTDALNSTSTGNFNDFLVNKKSCNTKLKSEQVISKYKRS